LPRSRPTVEGKVIGSPSAKLCVLHPGDYPQMSRHHATAGGPSLTSPHPATGRPELLMVRLHDLPSAPRGKPGHRRSRPRWPEQYPVLWSWRTPGRSDHRSVLIVLRRAPLCSSRSPVGAGPSPAGCRRGRA
jgi:hypothetical protein